MKYMLYTLLLVTLISAAGGPVNAAASPAEPSLQISSSVSEVTFGDSITVFCDVVLPDDYVSAVPFTDTETPYLDINLSSQSTEEIDGGRIEHFGFLTYVFSPDSVTVGPFYVTYSTAEGDTATVASNTISMPVASFAADSQAPPKPNRSPMEISSGGVPWWVLALILIAIAAVAYLIYRARRSTDSIQHAELVKPADPLEEFERIRAMHLYEKGQVKELYFLLTIALRRFMHGHMGFEAMYSTTEEILASLDRNAPSPEIAAQLRSLLNEADMVKFARYRPPEDNCLSVVDRAEAPVIDILKVIEQEKLRLLEEEQARSAETVDDSEASGEEVSSQ